MTKIGYAISSEEHTPLDLVEYARGAEEAGFSFALISDHYHPWVSQQGQSPFVWSVIGGISQVTQNLRVGKGVTCPIMRIHRRLSPRQPQLPLRCSLGGSSWVSGAART